MSDTGNAGKLAPPPGAVLPGDYPDEYEWQEEVDARGRTWYRRRPRFFGKRITIRVSSKEEGEAKIRLLAHLREQVRHNMIGEQEALRQAGALERGTILTVDDVWKPYALSQSARTRKIAEAAWCHHLAPHFSGKPAVSLDANAMRAWEVAERELPGKRIGELISPKTVRNAYDMLRTAFGRAVAAGHLRALPWEPGYRPPRVMAHAESVASREACRTVDELRRLVRAAMEYDERLALKGRWSDMCARVFVVAMLGLRQGEACGLAWEDLHLDDGSHDCVVVHQAVDNWRAIHPEWTRPLDPPKSARPMFALHPRVVDFLRSHRERLRDRGWYRSDGPVFPTIGGGARGGQWRDKSELLRPELFREIVRAAGLPNPERWVPHSLRHTFATLEGANASSLRDLQARTGHSSLRVLEGYMKSVGRGLIPSTIALEVGDDVPRVLAFAPVTAEGEILANLDDVVGVSVERGRAVQSERDALRRRKRAEDRKAFAERHALGGAQSYQVILGQAGVDEIRKFLSGKLGPKLNGQRRRAYTLAYLRSVRIYGKGEAARFGRLAMQAWDMNFFDALRRNAKARGCLPAGWAPPPRSYVGTVPTEAKQLGASRVAK